MKTKNLLKITFILFQCLLSNILFAQITPPPKQWDKRFGGSSSDGLESLQQTTDGGYILGGYSQSGIGGDKTEDSRGGYDYWVVKIDAAGLKQWDKRFGGSLNDYLTSLQQTNDGGYILGGYSYSGISGDKTQKSRGGVDYWVVKIDANGVKQWDKRFGGNGDDGFSSLQQTTDGGYILGGFSTSDIGGDKTEANWGDYTSDYWLLKIGANGVKLWDKRFGGTDWDFCESLQQTADGGYILGGDSYSGIGGDKTGINLGGYDYWVVKINSHGKKQWDKNFGGTANDDLVFSLHQTVDGGYILGGRSESGISGDKTESSRGDYDYWIIKTDINGSKQWDKRFGGSNGEVCGSVQQTIDGGYIIGGDSFSNSSGDKTEDSRGNNDFWVVKLGCPPSAGIIAVSDLNICTTGSVLLKVNSTDTLSYQWYKNNKQIAGATNITYTATTKGKYNVLVSAAIAGCSNTSNTLRVIDSCSPIVIEDSKSVNKQYISKDKLSIYPNPSKGNITLAYNSTKSIVIQVNIFDNTGRKLFTKTTNAAQGKNSYQLNLFNLSSGVYNLELKNSVEQQQVKFVIEK